VAGLHRHGDLTGKIATDLQIGNDPQVATDTAA
jgi:hypothetical protein